MKFHAEELRMTNEIVLMIRPLIRQLRTSYINSSRNVKALVLLFTITAICQFLLYWLINRFLGKDYIGLWALVVATTSIGQVSSFGLGNGLIRFIPEMRIKNDHEGIPKLVATVNLFNIIISIPVLLILFFLVQIYAKSLLSGEMLESFHYLSIWSMSAVFLNNLFSVYNNLLDGYEQFNIRSGIQISGWIFFILVVIIFMPANGISVIAIGFFLQAAWQLILAVLIAARKKIIPYGFIIGFDKESSGKIFSFGTRIQAISILVMFYDPLIKFFITKAMGLSATVNYELANKLTIQSRNLMANANLVIIPKLVAERNGGDVNDFFSNTTRKNTLISVFLGMLMLVFSPIAIKLLIGYFDPQLMYCIAIMNFGIVCVIITSIHYHACTALDRLSHIIVVHLIYSGVAFLLFLFLDIMNVNGWILYTIPALAFFCGSIYNSIALSDIKHALKWIKTDVFIIFLIESILIVLNMIYLDFSPYWISIPFLLVFIAIARKRYIRLAENA